MAQIIRLPLIPVLITYGLGLLAGQLDFPFSFPGPLFLLIPLILWFLLILFKRRLWSFWSALLFFFLYGLFSIQSYLHPNHSPSHISRWIGSEPILMEGTIDRSPQRDRGRTRWFIRSQKVISGDRHLSVDGDLLLWMKGEDRPLRLGDRIRFLCRIQRPQGFRNPGAFDYERHLAFERISAVGFLSDEKMVVKVGEGFKHPLLLKIEAWRDHIRHFLEKEASSPCASIFQALVLGEQGSIPEKVREHFIITGIAHLLAISGDHLGIVALLSYSLFLWLLKRSDYLLLSLSVKKWAAFLAIPCLLLYTFIAGGGISVVRATIMVITFFISIVLDRERHLLHTLALAAFLILLFSPPSLFDVSFQLSFLAVLSILYTVPRLLPHLKRDDLLPPPDGSWRRPLWTYLRLSLLATVVAMLGTAPFVILHFNRLSLVGFLTNLIAIPWVGFLVMPMALFASLLSFFIYPLASALISINQFLTTLLLQVVSVFATLPYASIHLATPTAFEMVLYYLLFFLSVHLHKGKKIRYLFVGISILLVTEIAYWHVKDAFQQNLRVTFLDVGHGDSILVEYPKGRRMLIDGGGLPEDRFDIGKNVIAPFLWKKKIRKIDTLVLTHPDPDHLKGLHFIASQFHIGQFWESGLRIDSECYDELEKTLHKRKIERRFMHEDIPPQIISGVKISFLNPPPESRGLQTQLRPALLNNQSLVMRLQYKKVSLLLTGDVEKEAEERMIQKGHSLRAQVLKVPHHGSVSSSSPTFLSRVKPEVAIFSVGTRSIGRLPHPEVIERYERLGAKIWRTDRDGAITLVTDGDEIRILPFHRH